MKWTQLLLGLLLALTFDAVVPFEPTAAGLLQLDDELEEAAQLRARRDHRRDTRAIARAHPAPLGLTAAPRVAVVAPRAVRPRRTETPTPPLRRTADPAAAPPAPGEDH